MSKDKISDYSATANSNTDIGGINIDEGCAPSGINDAIRTLMKQLKDWQSGSQDVYIHPAGSASAPSITATGDTNTGIFFPAADTVGISTGGTERARVDSSGNLGLGVTPSGTWKLDVAGYVKSAAAAGGLYDAVYTGTTAGSTLGQLRFNGSGSGVTAESKIIGALSSGSITSSYLGFYVTNAGSQSQAMTLDASGNLGVGATSVNGMLHLRRDTASSSSTGYPNIRIDNPNASGYTGLYFYADTTQKAGFEVSNSAGALQIFVANTERARIDSSGRWLVNATSAALSASKAQISYSPSADYGLVLYPTNTTYNNASVLFLNNAGTSVGYIYSTGSATTYSTTSDYRLKENIAPMTGALEKIAALKPCTYTWKADGSVSQGFIAHELQAVVPEAVVGEKDAVDEDGNPRYQGIDTSFLVATLTAAIQEQQAIIESLTARITALEA